MTAPMPHVDLVDVKDPDLVMLLNWYHARASDQSVNREKRLGLCISAFEVLAERIQARIDFERTKHMEFREYIRQPREREPGDQFGVPSRGEI